MLEFEILSYLATQYAPGWLVVLGTAGRLIMNQGRFMDRDLKVNRLMITAGRG
jgi:hypothetical protein